MRPLRFTRSRSSERASRSLGETMAKRKDDMSKTIAMDMTPAEAADYFRTQAEAEDDFARGKYRDEFPMVLHAAKANVLRQAQYAIEREAKIREFVSKLYESESPSVIAIRSRLREILGG